MDKQNVTYMQKHTHKKRQTYRNTEVMEGIKIDIKTMKEKQKKREGNGDIAG